MLVSILIPCFNAEPWIEQCIRSALEQVYAHKEVIVVDDGSTDKSRDIIRGFGSAVQFHEGPHAVANAARNRLTALARGEWLQYLDADDYLLPNKIDSQIQLIKQIKGHVDLIHAPLLGVEGLPDIADDDILNLINAVGFTTSGMLVRRSVVLSAGGWKEDQPCCQEYELQLRLFMAGARFVASRSREAIYRNDNSDSVSRRDPGLMIRTGMDLRERFQEYLRASGRLNANHRRAMFAVRMEYARYVHREDPASARVLATKAAVDGKWWVWRRPALPLRYQLVFRVLGFQRAERLAAWLRAVQ